MVWRLRVSGAVTVCRFIHRSYARIWLRLPSLDHLPQLHVADQLSAV